MENKKGNKLNKDSEKMNRMDEYESPSNCQKKKKISKIKFNPFNRFPKLKTDPNLPSGFLISFIDESNYLTFSKNKKLTLIKDNKTVYCEESGTFRDMVNLGGKFYLSESISNTLQIKENDESELKILTSIERGLNKGYRIPIQEMLRVNELCLKLIVIVEGEKLRFFDTVKNEISFEFETGYIIQGCKFYSKNEIVVANYTSLHFYKFKENYENLEELDEKIENLNRKSEIGYLDDGEQIVAIEVDTENRLIGIAFADLELYSFPISTSILLLKLNKLDKKILFKKRIHLYNMRLMLIKILSFTNYTENHVVLTILPTRESSFLTVVYDKRSNKVIMVVESKEKSFNGTSNPVVRIGGMLHCVDIFGKMLHIK